MHNGRYGARPVAGTVVKPPVNKPPNAPRKQPARRPKVGLLDRFIAFLKKPRERLLKFDVPLFTVILVLLVFGLTMLLSASSDFAAREHGDPYHFTVRQLGFVGLGLGAMIAISFINYGVLLKKGILTLVVGVALVTMLATNFGLGGVEQGGATRWLGAGGITFQPSEILKFAMITMLAYIVHTRYDKLKDFKKGFVPLIVIAGIACGLMIWQRHLSGTIVMFAIAATLILISPVRFKHILALILALAIAALIALPLLDRMSDADVSGRLQSWREPESDVTDKTFQTYQSLVTIGSGGWVGLGLGNSRQKFAYLPATHNDFVFSVVCEELGFVGGILVLLLFAVFVMRGLYIALHARDRFGMMLAAGITAQVGIQAFLNIAVVTNSVPNTGITLPFFSYGGTAMIMLMAQLGVLLNISRKAKLV